MPNALQITDPDSDNPLAQAPSWADAAQSVAGTVGGGVDALGQWLAAQRAKSSQMGLWNDQTGLPTGAGVVNAAQQTGNALLMGTTAPGIRAFHGSPHDFERFDTSKIGTGEGAQAYGHGLYAAEAEPVAESYLGPNASWRYGNTKAQTIYDRLNDQANERGLDNEGWNKLNAQRGFWEKVALGRAPRSIIDDAAANPDQYGPHELAYIQSLNPDKFKRSGGRMYEVNIGADPEHFLHWDKPLSEQSPQVQQALAKVHAEDPEAWQRMIASNPKGSELYESGGIQPSTQAQALRDAGIPGIRYLDQGSRGAGEGTHNYVVFDANTIDILRKYGIAGLGLGLSGAAATNGSQQQPPMAQ